MAASTKVLGPWAKGLNLTSNRDMSLYLDTDELGEATNVVYSPEGFVEPRPGFKKVLYDFGTYTSIQIIGTVDSVYSTNYLESRLIVQVMNGTQAKIYTVRPYDTSIQVTLLFTPPDGVKFTHVKVFKSTAVSGNHSGVFFFANQLNKSYRCANFDLTGAITLIDPNYAVPASDTGIIIRDRLFLFEYATSKMWWSPANYITDFNNYDKALYGDDSFSEEPVEPYPDDSITCISFMNNNIYIFKRTKTYMFTYQVLPGQDGYLRKINETMGARACTTFKENIFVLNVYGIFNVQGTDFIDIQRSMNFKYEVPFGNSLYFRQVEFLTSFHDNLLMAFKSLDGNGLPTGYYYYCWNSLNGAWSKWDFMYNAPGATYPTVAHPGSKLYRIRGIAGREVYMTIDYRSLNLTYIEYLPKMLNNSFHMDTLLADTASISKYLIPATTIKTKASIGDSPLHYTKLYRIFLRFYLSDLPDAVLTDTTELWAVSVNYNDYRFGYDTKIDSNPRLVLHPSEAEFVDNTQMENSNEGPYSAVYQRTYQIPISQQRVKEFVFELKRSYSEVLPSVVNALPTDPGPGMVNPDADRAIKNGYYFRLSNIWFDYQSKGGI